MGSDAEKRVAVALDVTNPGDRFHVLTAAVVYRGCAGPVAWAVLPADTKDPWNPHWSRLLDRVAAALGGGRAVLALTDRGLGSADLFRAARAVTWAGLLSGSVRSGQLVPEPWPPPMPIPPMTEDEFRPKMTCT